MLKGVLFVSVLTLYPIAIRISSAIPGKKLTARKSYIRQIIEQLILLSFFFVLAPESFGKLNFDRLGRGIVVDPGIFSGFTALFYVPVIMAFLGIGRFNAKSAESSQLFGYPQETLPDTFRVFLLFALNIVIGVIFEELFFRQLVFYTFNHVFLLRGDWLLLISCALFTIVHSYTKPLEIVFIVIVGAVLGKTFQQSGTILFPIGLHLCLSSTLILLAYKRIKKTHTNNHRPPS